LTYFLKSDSTDSEVYVNRGFCHDKVNNCSGAAQDFLKALTYDSLNEPMYELVAGQMLKCGDSLESLRIRRWHIQTLPPDYSPEPLMNLAELEINLRKYSEAHIHIDEALRMIGQWTTGPLYARAVRIKGLAYFKLQSFRDALDMFSRAHKADPENLDDWYMKAICHMHLGDRKTALREFDELRKRSYKDSEKFYTALLR
jgi:tetratricopeptide (TPR) repeat protein